MGRRMMRWCLALAVCVVSISAMKVDPTEIVDLGESVGDTINYHVTVKTQGDKRPADATDYTVQVDGKDGSVSHEFKPGYIPEKARDGSISGYKAGPTGYIQAFNFTGSDVGEVTKVKLKTSKGEAWGCDWVKVDTNDHSTGIGNGVYYVEVMDEVKLATPFETSSVVPSNQISTDQNLRKVVVRCQAESCEEEMAMATTARAARKV